MEAGQRTGLYTSPHLEKPNERIRVNREEITDEDFARLYFRVHDAAQDLVLAHSLPQLPSYFEILTAQAFLYFAESKVDIAVLEVGMGGRLDATNVVEPLISIITDISLDHMEWLGPTITAITHEKAGILRRGGTMIALLQHPEANQVLGESAAELGVRCVRADWYLPSARADGPGTVEALGATITVDSPLAGGHQKRNVALAIAAAVELAGAHGIPVTPAALEEGIRRTHWPGRLERIRVAGVDWILDVAHNPAGAWALRTGLPDVLGGRKPQTLIFSCLRDKPLAEMAQILFPLFEKVVVAPIHTARAAALDELLAAARATGTSAVTAHSVQEALEMAQDHSAGGVAVVSGSVYLVGEARALLLAGKEEAS
jgi:dihydrofolate synthase/folylpolyglutamate synthase